MVNKMRYSKIWLPIQVKILWSRLLPRTGASVPPHLWSPGMDDNCLLMASIRLSKRGWTVQIIRNQQIRQCQFGPRDRSKTTNGSTNRNRATETIVSCMSFRKCKSRIMKSRLTSNLMTEANSDSIRATWIWTCNSITVFRLVPVAVAAVRPRKVMSALSGKIQKECTLTKEVKCNGRGPLRDIEVRSRPIKVKRKCIPTPIPMEHHT